MKQPPVILIAANHLHPTRLAWEIACDKLCRFAGGKTPHVRSGCSDRGLHVSQFMPRRRSGIRRFTGSPIQIAVYALAKTWLVIDRSTKASFKRDISGEDMGIAKPGPKRRTQNTRSWKKGHYGGEMDIKKMRKHHRIDMAMDAIAM
jgi:hypothetical protein